MFGLLPVTSHNTRNSCEGSQGGRIFAPEVVNPKDPDSMGFINNCIVLDGHETEPALDQWKHVIYWPLQLTCATHWPYHRDQQRPTSFLLTLLRCHSTRYSYHRHAVVTIIVYCGSEAIHPITFRSHVNWDIPIAGHSLYSCTFIDWWSRWPTCKSMRWTTNNIEPGEQLWGIGRRPPEG